MKKVFIINGENEAFVNFLNKYIPTYKYSIVALPKEAAKVLGWGDSKNEKDRRFLNDVMDLSAEYNDAPFADVCSVVTDFKNNLIEDDVLMVDMNDPKDIMRAVETFGAETILIRNSNVEKIESNHADRDVENYEYDYIVENDGTLEQLDKVAKLFAREVVCWSDIPGHDKPLVLTCSNY